MSEITREKIQKAAAELRDELTVKHNGALIYPLALDVLATTPALCKLLAEKLAD
jgi:hypothetical protein